MSSVISQFLKLASPDIRTTLATLQGTLDLLEKTLADPAQHHLVSKAQVGVGRLNAMLRAINELDLVVAKQARRQEDNISLGHCLSEALASVAQEAAHCGVEIVVVSQPETKKGTALRFDHSLRFDHRKLNHAVLHILRHALLSSQSSSITVQLELIRERELSITIEDNGLGLQEEGLANLFSLQLDKQNSSKALRDPLLLTGLVLARELIKFLGGSLTPSNEAGVGPCWQIRLPVLLVNLAPTDANPTQSLGVEPASPVPMSLPDPSAEQTVSRASLIEPEPDPSSEERPSILLVDDSRSNRLVMKSVLNSLGYAVWEATNGLEAISALRERRHAAVLMDLAMPQMDGQAAAKLIRKIPDGGQSIPLIALTAHLSDNTERECLSAGFDSFLTKPVGYEAIRRTLAEAVGKEGASATERVSRTHLQHLARVMGFDELRLLLMQFSTEIEARLAALKQPSLKRTELAHNLSMLAHAAENLGFARLNAEAAGLLERLPEMKESGDVLRDESQFARLSQEIGWVANFLGGVNVPEDLFTPPGVSRR